MAPDILARLQLFRANVNDLVTRFDMGLSLGNERGNGCHQRVLSARVDFCRLHPCVPLAARIVVPDDPVNNLSDGYMLSLSFALYLLNKRLLYMQCPTLSRSR